MIRYSLNCSAGHDFEGWFRNGADFDGQVTRGDLICPLCGDIKVEKALMAPAVSTSRRKDAMPQAGNAAPEEATAQEAVPADDGAHKAVSADRATPPARSEQAQFLAKPDPRQEHLVRMMRQLKAAVTANADNVGTEFPKEARRMHYGEAETRSIYGSASAKEARELIDEGIQVLRLPTLPEDKN